MQSLGRGPQCTESYLLTVCRYLRDWHRTDNAGKVWQRTVTGKGFSFCMRSLL